MKLKTKRLLIALGVAVAVLIGYNRLIAHLATRSQRQHALAVQTHPPADTAVVFLGNSLMEAGGDPAAFRAAWPLHPAPSLNLALGATSPVEHYLIMKNALDHGLRPQWLVYGYFDDQLNATIGGDWSDLVGNRALSYYFPEQAAELYVPGSSLKRWQLSVTQRLPMLSERSSLWTKVERWRRQLGAIGLPTQATNRFGRVNDFGPRGPEEIASFERRCRSITDGQVGFSAPIRQIIELAQAHQIRVVLVEMPLPRPHRAAFYTTAVWPRLRQQINQLAAASGASYLNASDWVNDDDQFADSVHLNPAGARLFSSRLALWLAKLAPPDQSGSATLAQNPEGRLDPASP